MLVVGWQRVVGLRRSQQKGPCLRGHALLCLVELMITMHKQVYHALIASSSELRNGLRGAKSLQYLLRHIVLLTKIPARTLLFLLAINDLRDLELSWTWMDAVVSTRR